MDDALHRPARLSRIKRTAGAVGFEMSSSDQTGALLSVLAASKPSGNLLEIGTGLGAGVAWILEGMNLDAHLTTIEINGGWAAMARSEFAGEERVEFVCADAHAWLDAYTGPAFDLAFVDWRAGKFAQLDQLIGLLAPGGIYIVDDLIPQATWPEDHPERIARFWDEWPRADMVAVPIGWASGLLIGAKS
ncbi:class I SAM-dependent methyltransferase [Glycomyces sp. A-F 0318]|uniref:O-methyltransferase n=1 Tax=Glycomyces amatae TaxID=2881355 RepID=UPI001E3BF11A|nr:class I SAM-dependent methyltransferase [Glycomyces amatae]MCD0444265.1 class I SAM-dependent methyltransferase [Glycomyces amatae]